MKFWAVFWLVMGSIYALLLVTSVISGDWVWAAIDLGFIVLSISGVRHFSIRAGMRR